MAQQRQENERRQRHEALAWIAEQLQWEDRLARLRRPGGSRPARSRRPRPDAGLRRAG